MRDINSLNNNHIYQLKEKDVILDEMDPVNVYREWIKFSDKPITDIEELKVVFSKIREEDALFMEDNSKKKVKNDFISRNLGLVLMVVKKYVGRGISEEDLIQIGNIGLINAVNTYKPDLEFKFSTYAVTCIRNSIMAELLKDSTIISVSTSDMREMSKVFKTKNEMMYEMGRIPTDMEIAERLGVSVKKVQEAYCVSNGVMSFDKIIPDPRNNHSEEGTLHDFVADERVDLQDEYEKKELREILEKIMTRILTPTELDIVKKYYGFDDMVPMTYEQIGELNNGVTRQCVEQKLKSIYSKLSRSYDMKRLAIYLDGDVYSLYGDLSDLRDKGYRTKKKSKK